MQKILCVTIIWPKSSAVAVILVLYYSKFCFSEGTVFVFQLFDRENRGSLSAEELSDLMGALLGVPQHNTAELYTQASNHGRLTEGECLSNEFGSIADVNTSQATSSSKTSHLVIFGIKAQKWPLLLCCYWTCDTPASMRILFDLRLLNCHLFTLRCLQYLALFRFTHFIQTRIFYRLRTNWMERFSKQSEMVSLTFVYLGSLCLYLDKCTNTWQNSSHSFQL